MLNIAHGKRIPLLNVARTKRTLLPNVAHDNKTRLPNEAYGKRILLTNEVQDTEAHFARPASSKVACFIVHTYYLMFKPIFGALTSQFRLKSCYTVILKYQ